MTRVVTNEDIKKYIPMVNMWLNKSVVKNWNEASLRDGDEKVSLGNSGFTIEDIRQHLTTEVVVALQNYNPDYRTKDGRAVKESTFVYTHLYNRIGQLMKKLTKKRYGYGIWNTPIHDFLDEYHGED